ncbi:hypothetical protein KC352_g9550, partial [Hortaea werneckii]
MARERKTASLASAAGPSALSSRAPSHNPSTVANRRSARVAVANSSETEDAFDDAIVVLAAAHYKGGLLGDEMGMGKTIQAVSLVMSDYPQKDPTLVVVPPVALMQWSTEIKEYTDGKLNVLVYHGQNSKIKGMSVKELKKYDVIMISYNSLESLHRKETKGWSRGEDLVKEDSPIHAIHFHRLILDEAHSIKSRTTGVAKA